MAAAAATGVRERLRQLQRHVLAHADVQSNWHCCQCAQPEVKPVHTSGAAATAAPAPQLQFSHFYTYAEVTEFLASLAAAYPSLCEVQSIGESRQGRAISALQIGAGDPAATSHYLIYGCT